MLTVDKVLLVSTLLIHLYLLHLMVFYLVEIPSVVSGLKFLLLDLLLVLIFKYWIQFLLQTQIHIHLFLVLLIVLLRKEPLSELLLTH